MSKMYVTLSFEECDKLNKRSARCAAVIGAMAAHKPDPTAVVAQTEIEHHNKADNLRRTNEKIDAIEKCIASDTGAEVHIRQDIAENQRVIDDVTEESRARQDHASGGGGGEKRRRGDEEE